jgi:hypothetical protein
MESFPDITINGSTVVPAPGIEDPGRVDGLRYLGLCAVHARSEAALSAQIFVNPEPGPDTAHTPTVTVVMSVSLVGTLTRQPSLRQVLPLAATHGSEPDLTIAMILSALSGPPK